MCLLSAPSPVKHFLRSEHIFSKKIFMRRPGRLCRRRSSRLFSLLFLQMCFAPLHHRLADAQRSGKTREVCPEQSCLRPAAQCQQHSVIFRFCLPSPSCKNAAAGKAPCGAVRPGRLQEAETRRAVCPSCIKPAGSPANRRKDAPRTRLCAFRRVPPAPGTPQAVTHPAERLQERLLYCPRCRTLPAKPR